MASTPMSRIVIVTKTTMVSLPCRRSWNSKKTQNKADTDDDGLNDGVETNTGTYVDATDSGTDPLNADTDDDGLPDGQEVPGGEGPWHEPASHRYRR